MTSKVTFLVPAGGSGSKSLRVNQEFGLFLLGTLSACVMQAHLPQCMAQTGLCPASAHGATGLLLDPVLFAPAGGHPWPLLLSGPWAGPTFPCFQGLRSTLGW